MATQSQPAAFALGLSLHRATSVKGMLHSRPRLYLDVEGLLQCLQVLLQSCCLLPPKFCQVRVKVGLISNVMKALAVPYEVHHLQVRQSKLDII